MERDLSYESNNEYHPQMSAARGYAGAMVSTSLGSMNSFHLASRSPSPRAATKRTTNATDPMRKKQKPLEPLSSLSDASLDEMIDTFRASASSMTFSNTARSERRATSSPATTPRRAKPVSKVPSPKHQGRFTRAQLASDNSSSDDGEVGVSPMPKLTHLPKPKPSLAIAAPKKTTMIPTSGKPMQSFGYSSKPTVGSTRSKLPSPKKISRPPVQSVPQAPRRQEKRSPPPSPPSSMSDQSTTSSLIEEDIDAPDSDISITGEESIDDLISHDLRQLHKLVSSSHEKLAFSNNNRNTNKTSKSNKTNNQNTNVGNPHQQNANRWSSRNGKTGGPASSFRVFSASSSSSFRLEPVDSVFHRHRRENEEETQDEQDEQEDSFAEELRAMKNEMLKDKQKAAAKKQDEKKKKKKKALGEEEDEDHQPGAQLASLRDAVDAIDKNLLLALRPFELMKLEMEKEDAKIAKTEENELAKLDLPMATQGIVEQLEQAFGGQTRQREAELKAVEDAAAAVVAAEDAKKKEEETKKAAEELVRKQQELEVLKLIPLRGKLLATEGDIHDTLLRLEMAETFARGGGDRGREGSSLGHELEALREYTARRTQEIEGMAFAVTSDRMPAAAPRTIDWHRATFHLNDTARDVQENAAHDSSHPAGGDDEATSFPEILKSEVVDKLEFTIMKLKHALSIDQKDAEDATRERKRSEAEAKKTKAKQDAEILHKSQVEADAAAARQRVMGMASLDELTWVAEADARLRDSLKHERALQRLEHSLHAAQSCEPHAKLPSFFDDSSAPEKRFDGIKMLMEAPYLVKLQQARDGGGFPQQHRHHGPVSTRYGQFGGTRRTVDERSWRPWHPHQGADEVDRHKDTHSHERERDGHSHSAPPPALRSMRTTHTQSPSYYDTSSHHTNHHDEQSSPNTVSAVDRRPSRGPETSATVALHHGPKRILSSSSHGKKRDKRQDELMLTIHQLQADRREKAYWFHASTRPA